jgi:type I restriction enzyme S subunit
MNGNLTIGDIFFVKGGKRLPKGSSFSEIKTSYPYLRVVDFEKNGLKTSSVKYISEDIQKQIKNYTISSKDVYISIAGTIGIAGFIPENLDGANLTENAAKLVVKDSYDIDKRYLSFYLNSPKIQEIIRTKTMTVGVPKLALFRIEEIPFEHKAIEIQRKIADILEKADLIRKKRVQTNKKIAQLLQSVFTNIFGNPSENLHKWEIKPLQEIADVASGVTKGRKLENKETFSVPYMRVANVQDGHLNLQEIKYIEVLQSDIDKYRLRKGDVLLTEGGDPDKLGRGAVWNDEIPNCIHQNHIFRVRTNSDFIIPEYMSALFGSSYGKKYFLKAAKQTTGIASINSTQLKAFPVLLPPLELQRKYLSLTKKIDILIAKAEKSEQKINELFNSLMHQVFNEELKFSEVEIEAERQFAEV